MPTCISGSLAQRSLGHWDFFKPFLPHLSTWFGGNMVCICLIVSALTPRKKNTKNTCFQALTKLLPLATASRSSWVCSPDSVHRSTSSSSRNAWSPEHCVRDGDITSKQRGNVADEEHLGGWLTAATDQYAVAKSISAVLYGMQVTYKCSSVSKFRVHTRITYLLLMTISPTSSIISFV